MSDELATLGFKSALNKMEREGNTAAGITERPLRIQVWFVPQAVRDDVASRKLGRPIYKETVYVGRRNIGDVDYVTQPATPELIAEYPEEWAEYQRRVNNPRSSILHLPGIELHPAIRMYCEDAKIASIEALAEAPNVQPELKEAQELARRWVGMMQGTLEEPKKRGGRVKGSKNKPKVNPDVQDTERAA